MEQLITATFTDLNEANRALDRLVDLHYPPERISVTMSGGEGGRPVADTAFDERANSTDAIRFSIIGAGIGAVVGIVGAFAVFGTDFGPWSLGTLAAFIDVSLWGMLIGALLGVGVPNAHHQPSLRIDENATGEMVSVAVQTPAEGRLVWSVLQPHVPLAS